MENRGEPLLQVDAFAQAVSSDEDPWPVNGHPLDALLAQVVRVLAGNDLEVQARDLLRQQRSEVRPHIVGGFDVAAEHHGVEAARYPVFKYDRGCVEFLVILGTGEGSESRGGN